MHCLGAATALTLVHLLSFEGQLGALFAGAAVGFYAPVRASQVCPSSAPPLHLLCTSSAPPLHLL